MRKTLLLPLLLAATLSHAATEGTDRSPIRQFPIGVVTGVMKPKTATTRDTLFVARGDSNGVWSTVRPSDAITIASGASGDSTGTNNARAFTLFATAVDVGRYAGGAIEAVVTCVDSVEADSLATELYVMLSGSSQSAGLIPFDSDDSDGAKLDGWMLTTLDSTSLSAAGNITPITGAASTVGKYPFGMSSRIICGQHQRSFQSVGIPGAEGLEFGGLAGANTNTKIVSFWIPLTDAFGNFACARTMQVALLNRHPRRGGNGDTWSLKFWPKIQ